MSEPRRLPLIEARQRALELCGYCPKLCRTTCPVSDARPEEPLIPWGKMSTAWFVARGVVAADADHARTAWACSRCHACQSFCEHDNPVADTLTDARGEYFERGVAPPAMLLVSRSHGRRMALLKRRVRRLRRAWPAVQSTETSTALVLGCGYALGAPAAARSIMALVEALVGPVVLVEECCGAPLRDAGDRAGFEIAQERMTLALRGIQSTLVADPGCALTLRKFGAQPLITRVAQQLERFQPAPHEDEPHRYHDPCQLGRGLGVYAAPRAVLARVLGRAADEFVSSREQAYCSGGGALLPKVYPEVAAANARTVVERSAKVGDGTIVTACGQAYRQLAAQGAKVRDLYALAERGLVRGG